MNRRLYSFLVLGLLACYGGDNTSKHSNDTFSEEAVSDLPHFKSVVDGIHGAATVDLYEGLPHQLWEREAFERELATKKTVKLHEFQFYEHPLAISADDVKLLRQISVAPESYREYVPEPCGGFHPDYALVWKEGEHTYDLLICFGCGDVQLHGPQQELMAKMASGKFGEILSKYRSQRPDRE